MPESKFRLLNTINSPTDLKKLSADELVKLCCEIRQFLVEAVSTNPGHFGASLGVVELTVALHHVFDTPNDKIVWDVGHQAYPHKILTGRKDVFHLNRKYKGISGFPKMSESPYDAFGTGHSSTSISAALGMAIASKLQGDSKRQHIAVIGDGSMTAGMAFEALNHAGVSGANLLVILNDNGIAIDKNVGALSDYLTDITTSKTYNRLKDDIWNLLGTIGKYGPDARGLVQKMEAAFKTSVFKQSNLFESFNFRYFGPVDGHDVQHLTMLLNDLKNLRGPKLLHVVTKKGKGYTHAEKEQTRFHAPGCFDMDTGQSIIDLNNVDKPQKYQEVFGETILELAKLNPRIVAITPAMTTGCSLNIMMEAMPERTFDVGIAEQHAVTFAAGLAVNGLIPFCNIYSSFFQRAFDQAVHDVALQKLPVVFCLDRGGLVGEDGATHHGSFDLSFMRCIPDIIISSPMNEAELRNLLYTAQLKPQGPFLIRYPRGNGVLKNWQKPFEEIPIGKGRMLKNGEDVAVITIGPIGNTAAKAIEDLEIEQTCSIAHYDLRFLKPIDAELLHLVCKKHHTIITVEDNATTGGMGSAILEFISENNYAVKLIRLGIPDRFIEQGSLDELHAECGMDKKAISETILKAIAIPMGK